MYTGLILSRGIITTVVAVVEENEVPQYEAIYKDSEQFSIEIVPYGDYSNVLGHIFLRAENNHIKTLEKPTDGRYEPSADGKSWTCIDTEEIKWAILNDDIRRILQESDVTQTLDWPEESRLVWASYRQTLRDLNRDYATQEEARAAFNVLIENKPSMKRRG